MNQNVTVNKLTQYCVIEKFCHIATYRDHFSDTQTQIGVLFSYIMLEIGYSLMREECDAHSQMTIGVNFSINLMNSNYPLINSSIVKLIFSVCVHVYIWTPYTVVDIFKTEIVIRLIFWILKLCIMQLSKSPVTPIYYKFHLRTTFALNLLR